MDDFYQKFEALIGLMGLLDVFSEDSLKEKTEELDNLKNEELKLQEKKLKFVEGMKDMCEKK